MKTRYQLFLSLIFFLFGITRGLLAQYNNPFVQCPPALPNYIYNGDFSQFNPNAVGSVEFEEETVCAWHVLGGTPQLKYRDSLKIDYVMYMWSMGGSNHEKIYGDVNISPGTYQLKFDLRVNRAVAKVIVYLANDVKLQDALLIYDNVHPKEYYKVIEKNNISVAKNYKYIIIYPVLVSGDYLTSIHIDNVELNDLANISLTNTPFYEKISYNSVLKFNVLAATTLANKNITLEGQGDLFTLYGATLQQTGTGSPVSGIFEYHPDIRQVDKHSFSILANVDGQTRKKDFEIEVVLPSCIDFDVNVSVVDKTSKKPGSAKAIVNKTSVTYLWSNGKESSTISNLDIGDYFLTATWTWDKTVSNELLDNAFLEPTDWSTSLGVELNDGKLIYQGENFESEVSYTQEMITLNKGTLVKLSLYPQYTVEDTNSYISLYGNKISLLSLQESGYSKEFQVKQENPGITLHLNQSSSLSLDNIEISYYPNYCQQVKTATVNQSYILTSFLDNIPEKIFVGSTMKKKFYIETDIPGVPLNVFLDGSAATNGAYITTDNNITPINGFLQWQVTQGAIGNQDFILYILDGKNQSTYIQKTTEVLNKPTISSKSSCTSTLVTLTTNSVSSQVNYLWNFGDGTTYGPTKSLSVTHQYPANGEYQVSLKTYYDNPATGFHVEDLAFANVQAGPPKAEFEVKDVCLGYPAYFTNVTSNASKYEWIFFNSQTPGASTSNEKEPVYMFTETGNHLVQLKVTKGNCVSELFKPVMVESGVSAEIRCEGIDQYNQVCITNPIRLVGENPLSGSDDKGVSYKWFFYNMHTGQLLEQKSGRVIKNYLFPSGGDYKVELLVSNGSCSKSEFLYVYVQDKPRVELVNENPLMCPGGSSLLRAKLLDAGTFQYQWFDKDSNTISRSSSVWVGDTGAYSLVVMSVCNQGDPLTTRVDYYLVPEVEATVNKGVSCPGRKDGMASITLKENDENFFPLTLQHDGNEHLYTSYSELPIILNNLQQSQNIITIITPGNCPTIIPLTIPYQGPVVKQNAPSQAYCNAQNASIELEVSGGTPAYHYTWSNGVNGNTNDNITLEGLGHGKYTLTLTDATQCTIEHSMLVTLPQVIIDVEDALSCGNDPVEVEIKTKIDIDKNNFTPLFSYTLNQIIEAQTLVPVNGASFPNPQLNEGNYQIEVVEQNTGCTASKKFKVTYSKELELETASQGPTCFYHTHGSMWVDVNNVKGELYLKWYDGSSAMFEGETDIYRVDSVLPGQYNVIATDSRGCGVEQIVEVPEAPASIEVSEPPTSQSCLASVEATPDDEYTYYWIRILQSLDTVTAMEATNTVEKTTTQGETYGLTPGVYHVMVQNSSSCLAVSDTFKVLGSPVTRKFKTYYAFSNPVKEEKEEKEEKTNKELESIISSSEDQMLSQVQKCKSALTQDIKASFENVCLNNKQFKDQLTLSYQMPQYQYTLYYYDRAGNLVKTVPPEGVSLLDATAIDEILLSRQGGDPSSNGLPVNNHALETKYTYNSLGQLQDQKTPDAGQSQFIYNKLGQLRYSQNARQASSTPALFSYTRYDLLGRITEVGESTVDDFTSIALYADTMSYPANNCRQITRSVYSDPAYGIAYQGKSQRYLDNRISYTYLDQDGKPETTRDNVYTYYSYDPHGNVEWLIQDIPGLGKNFIEYSYDLISGNVLEVTLNSSRPDRFTHAYQYDEDNRIKQVHTSTNGVTWDNDATYYYYNHGPLERLEIGEDKIQGLDYTYTIEGWLKAINSPDVYKEWMDIPYIKEIMEGVMQISPAQVNQGQVKNVIDLYYSKCAGKNATKPCMSEPEKNDLATEIVACYNQVLGQGDLKGASDGSELESDFLEDVFGMVLGYHKNDFQRTYNGVASPYNTMNDFAYQSGNKDLYNGNISSWTIGQQYPGIVTGNHTDKMTSRVYTYDKLNRIKNAQFYVDDVTEGFTSVNAFNTSYSYDKNGNITSLTRNDGSGEVMDNLDYQYNIIDGKLRDNKLKNVKDNATYANNGKLEDLFNTTTYQYDPEGNLEHSLGKVMVNGVEKTENTFIRWNVYGKVHGVIREVEEENVSELLFTYDATGNRVRKEYWADTLHRDIKTTTFYVRDASGNIMGVYEREDKKITYDPEYTHMAEFRIMEQPIYGSDRLGMYRKSEILKQYKYIYTGDTLPHYQVGVIRPQGFASLNNWLSPAGTPMTSLSGDTLCDCQLKKVQFTDNTYNASPVASSFMGKASGNIAVGEDYNGNLLFYTTTPENYFGNENICLIFDRQGKLMKNSHGIKSSPQAKPMIIKQGSNNGRYVLITIGTDRKPYAHLIDMSNRGNGDHTYNGGVVLQKNICLDNSGNYGLNMAAIEDGYNNIGLVYLTRYIASGDDVPGQTDIMVVEVSENATPTMGSRVISLPSYDKKGQGELQVSADGKYLLYYNRQLRVSGFAHQEVELDVLALDESGKKAQSIGVKHGNKAGHYGPSSISLSSGGSLLYYNQQGIYLQGATSSSANTWLYGLKSGQEALLGTNFGSLRLARDGYTYIANKGQTDHLSYIEQNQSTQEIKDKPVQGDYTLTGDLPQQAYRVAPVEQGFYSRQVGLKEYELKDHLGNVRMVVSDRRQLDINTTENLLAWSVDVRGCNDYYAFGSLMPGRSFNASDYRFGFQGQEKDDEIAGTGNSYTAQFWQYDPRVARRWNVDPVFKEYESPYAAFANNPIWFIDPNGADSSLYDLNSGSQIDKGITPEDDKTAIWLVDTKQEGYDSENPWKSAYKLTYNVGNKDDKNAGLSTGITGNSFRKNHPLYNKRMSVTGGYAMPYGAQVYEEDLMDLSSEFNGLLVRYEGWMKDMGNDCRNSAFCNQLLRWRSYVNDHEAFDIKSTKRNNLTQIPSYAAIVIGEWSFWNGHLMRYDDYGNISYGYWGSAFGLSSSDLLRGANINQDKKNRRGITTGSGDEYRDAYKISFGILLYK